MKRKTILGISLIIPILLLTIVVASNSALGSAEQPKSNVVTDLGALGSVVLQLPSNSSPPALPGGTPNHPTTLMLEAHVESNVNYTTSLLGVFIWRPILNEFEPVAIIVDNPDAAKLLQTVWNNTFVWFIAGPPTFPPNFKLFPNVITVEPKDLQVWTESNGQDGSKSVVDQLMVNLNKAVTITLPFFNATGVNSNQTFILPPLSLIFKATSGEFDLPTTISYSGFSGASNYTQVRTGAEQFAGVRVSIPSWLSIGATSQYTLSETGIVRLNFVDTYIPQAAFGNTNIGTYQDQNDAKAKSASYFMCSKTETVTDIFAYVAQATAAGDGAAAIYADNGGSPGALIATTKKATISTAYSWVDFQLPSPVNVISGTGYWLAISSDSALNLNIIVGSGVRVHNGISSWFSNPFGPVWGTNDAGAMSIYVT
jgi:hypothetical protein